jgi:hypothetical protein
MKQARNIVLHSFDALLRNVKSTPIKGYAGVSGLGMKFGLVFLLYAFAFAFMGKDPWYGAYEFEWTQGVIALLISFFVVTTLAFDWEILGTTKGPNCLLSLILMIPFSLFTGRIMGKNVHSEFEMSLLGGALDQVKNLSGFLGLTSMIPNWMQEVFSSPGTALILLGVCGALAVRNKIAQKGLLLSALLLPFLTSFAYEPKVSYWFVGGMLFMFCGIAIQYLDMNRYHWSAVIISSFENVLDVAERESLIRVMEYVRKHGRMTDKALYAIISRCYRDQHQIADADFYHISLGIAQRLVAEHGLLKMHTTNDGQYFVINERIFVRDNVLAEIIRWPRNLIIGIVGILWLLSPIDIMPDTLPGGTIDDALISVLGFSPLMQQIGRGIRQRGEGIDGGDPD